MHQKSSKIHPGTFQGPSVCICDPLDCKMVPKLCPETSQRTQNGHLGTLKGCKNQQNQIITSITNRFIFLHFLIDFNPGNQFFHSCQSCQSANQQATGYQRGRRQGRSLKINSCIYIYIYIIYNIYIYIYACYAVQPDTVDTVRSMPVIPGASVYTYTCRLIDRRKSSTSVVGVVFVPLATPLGRLTMCWTRGHGSEVVWLWHGVMGQGSSTAPTATPVRVSPTRSSSCLMN